MLACKPEEVIVRPGRFASPSGKTLNWKQVTALAPPDGLTFRGTWKDGLSSTTTHPVQFAEVEVDTETGKVNVLKIVAVQDCGLCLNELLTESQIEVLEARSVEKEHSPGFLKCRATIKPMTVEYEVRGDTLVMSMAGTD